MRAGRRLGAVVSAVAVLGLSLSACSSSAGGSAPGVTKTEIKVGALATVTGPLSSGFGEIVAGVRAYFDMVNAQGGVAGRKLVLSNAPRSYALAVLEVIGVAKHFDALHCIEATRYQPKPALGAFHSLLREHGLIASRCVMIEDSRENLRPAKRLGMKTVWITRETRTPAYVDLKTASVLALPRLFGRLGL